MCVCLGVCMRVCIHVCSRQTSGTHGPRAWGAGESVVARGLLFPWSPTPGVTGPEDTIPGGSLPLALRVSARDDPALQGTCASVWRQLWLSHLEAEAAPGIWCAETKDAAQHPTAPRTSPPQRVTQSRRGQGRGAETALERARASQRPDRRGLPPRLRGRAAPTGIQHLLSSQNLPGVRALVPCLTGSLCGLTPPRLSCALQTISANQCPVWASPSPQDQYAFAHSLVPQTPTWWTSTNFRCPTARARTQTQAQPPGSWHPGDKQRRDVRMLGT